MKPRKTWTAGTTKTFMQLLRSDTHGSQFLLHDSGKQWTRFNVNDDAIPAASAYPAVIAITTLLCSSRTSRCLTSLRSMMRSLLR